MRLEWTHIIAFFLAFAVVACDSTGSKAPDAQQDDSETVKAYGRFVEIRKARPIDFAALSRDYEKGLAGYVKEADGRYGTLLHQDVCRALEKGRVGLDIYANAQIAEKSIQRAFILTFTRNLVNLERDPGDHKNLLLVREAAPIIRSTAQRRSEWVGRGREYADTFDAAMNRLMGAVARKNREAAADAKSQMESLVTKILVLSVLYELDGLEKARGRDADKASEKLAEARIYHINLMDEHERRDREGAGSVAGQLARLADQVDIDFVKKVLAKDFQHEVADVDPSFLRFGP